MNPKPLLGWLIIIVIAAIPAITVISIGSTDFSSLGSGLYSIGKLVALIGICLFAFTFVLNTRLRFIEDLFGGLDKVYIAHHILGTITFLFILFHPFLLASQLISVSFSAALNFLLPNTNLATNLGLIALVLMIIFIAITFFANWKYQNWKFSHRFLGLAFVVAGLHILFISSDVSRNLFLRMYISIIIIVGLVAYSYRTLFWKYLVKRYRYKVVDVKDLRHRITELSLKPEKTALKFIPGQFVFISLYSEIGKEVHPFTISSSSEENNLRLSIKDSGDYTSKIKEVKNGTKAQIEGPFGRFSYLLYDTKDQIWIAGGIGITPFLSMARSFDEKYNIDLYYSVSKEEEALFLDELNAISKRKKGLRIIPFFSSKQGRISANFIENESKGLNGKKIFICGPAAMMYSLKEQLIKKGVKRKDIHMEEFSLL